MRIHLDFELASTLNLEEVGADVWTRHPGTVPICASYAIDDNPIRDFVFSDPDQTLADANSVVVGILVHDAEIHAWNAAFERLVWQNILVPRFGFPRVRREQFHCTMAAAACAGLPMKLEQAAAVLGGAPKDKVGATLMKRMARPRGFNPDGSPRWWHVEDPGRLQQLIYYNGSDVIAERDVWRRIPRMPKREREIWLVDQWMNDRGMPVDRNLIGALSAVTLQEMLRVNQEIMRKTQSAVNSSAQNVRLLAWLQGQGYPHDSLAKDTLLGFLETLEFRVLPKRAQEVLLLRAEAAKTSVAKLTSLMKYSQIDGTARHLVQYGGAVRTLRWAGRGPQIQNFPRPVIKHVPQAIDCILSGVDGDGIRALFGKPLDVVSSCLRGVFRAPKGHAFVVCDFHAVEAIVLAWLAEDTLALDVFRRGEDIYVHTANAVGSNDRTLGKVLRLACGYGMGPVKFRKTALNYGLVLTPQEAENAVRAFRTASGSIVGLWRDYEHNARSAICDVHLTYWAMPIGFRMALRQGRLAGSLLIEKPTGGNLIYRKARIDSGTITFDGVNQYTRQWAKLTTYGGKLVENVTQSVARDLIADAMVQVENAFPGTLVSTIHDEIVCLIEEDRAEALFKFLKRTMSTAPSWAPDMPLSASGYIAERYAKA
jgi:DNA polymerase bacteriophage-type